MNDRCHNEKILKFKYNSPEKTREEGDRGILVGTINSWDTTMSARPGRYHIPREDKKKLIKLTQQKGTHRGKNNDSF